MEFIKRMNLAIEYLEENINQKNVITEASKLAYISSSYFQRAFQIISGKTATEYLRCRRLTKASKDLKDGKRVIDVAIDYGYQTPEAFAKAFKKMHGINPSSLRHSDVSLKAYPRISFDVSIEGNKAINYRFFKKDSFKVMGKSKRFSFKNYANFPKVMDFWKQSKKEYWFEKLYSSEDESGVMLGVSKDFDFETDSFTYMIAAERNGICPQDLYSIQIPKANWAIFQCECPTLDSIKSLWKHIFLEWMPGLGYEHDSKPEIEYFYSADLCEIWIPIKLGDKN